MMPIDLGREQFLIRELVKRILTNAHNFEWSIQGFGMLRLYLENSSHEIWSRSIASRTSAIRIRRARTGHLPSGSRRSSGSWVSLPTS
jgi:hypothetical protein